MTDDGSVAVVGGSGFLGSAVVRVLAAGGAKVRIAARHIDTETVRKLLEGHRGVTGVRADIRDPASVAGALAGCSAVVNCVSAYVEAGGVTYHDIHVRGARTLAEAAARAGIPRLVLISGIGADPRSRSAYIRARGEGEIATREALPGATVLRPSVMFGPGDAFLNAFAGVVRASPIFPLIGGGHTRLQPVFVDDVARAVAAALADPATCGATYELGGPKIHTLRELVALVVAQTGRHRAHLSVPFPLAHVLAAVSELLPAPPLTRAQVELLESDNVVAADMPGFSDLGIAPATLEDLLPLCLDTTGA